MILEVAARAPVGLLPVVAFLAALMYFDSYKLVGLRIVVATIFVGAAAAGLCYVINDAALRRLSVDFITYSRYVSPVIEETIKALTIVYLIRSQRIAFLVDAAIYGFAVGTGFAVVENLYYLSIRPDSLMPVWVVRGFGTAIMHGGATAIFAIISMALTEKRPGDLTALLPGLAAAIVLHSAFNHFLFQPVLSTLGILIALPPLAWLVFRRSERSVGDWLGADFDADARLLELLDSDEFDSVECRILSAIAAQPFPRRGRGRHALLPAAAPRARDDGEGHAPDAAARPVAGARTRHPRQVRRAPVSRAQHRPHG